MNEAEAKAELEAVEAGFTALYADAAEAGGGCWWCCGGGDARFAELEARKAFALTALELAPFRRR